MNFKKALLKVIKHSPEILIGAGVVLLIGAILETLLATTVLFS